MSTPAWLRFKDWPLRAKIVVLLVAASVIPLAIATAISVSNARRDEYRAMERLLEARAEMLAQRIDGLNTAFSRYAGILALASPESLRQAMSETADVPGSRELTLSLLQFWTQVDPGLRGVALLDATGRVVIGTEPHLEGQDLSRHAFMRRALAGEAVISDVFLADTPRGGIATIGYLAPIRDAQGGFVGVAAMWANASRLVSLLAEVNDEAGEGSFAILVDALGIRIAHPGIPETVYRPVAPLAPEDIEALVAEGRYGPRTRELLTGVAPVFWEPEVHFSELPGQGMFRARGVRGDWLQAVGQRCATVPWMIFYQVPERILRDAVAAVMRDKLAFAALIMAAAFAAGLLFAAAIVRPVRQLARGARALGGGNFDTRVRVERGDELGELGTAFNVMAARIQEQAAALRRESEDQYRRLFEAMNESFCTIEVIFDQAGNAVDFVYLETNGMFEQETGLGDVRGRRASEVFPDMEDHWLRIYAGVARTGEAVEFDQEDRFIGRHYHVSAYRVGGPESRRVAVLFSDVTTQKHAQQRNQAQLESLDLLQQITRAIGERQDLPSILEVVLAAIEGRFGVDFTCLCLYSAAQARLHVERVGQRSRPLADTMGLQAGKEIPIDANGLSRCVAGELVYEPDVREIDFAFPQRLAAAGLRALVVAPLQVESQVFGVLVAARASAPFTSPECEFLRQLSEHVALAAHHAQLYAALQDAYQELRETQQAVMQQERLRALGQMASGIAHDINNAISPVVLYTDSLLEREKGLSNEGRSQLQTVQRAIHDVAATVSRMREFYRAREPQITLAPVDLNALVTQVIDLTRVRWANMAQGGGITIGQRSELAPQLPPIHGAANEIREALTNLVFNAVDAMPAGGMLTLRTRLAESGRVSLEVLDTGLGMNDETRRRCLEPFFTTKGERGTGLGLAMVYGMAQRHGAAIEIDSVPGDGTCVRLLFPAADAMPMEEPTAELPIPRALRILLIDDDPVVLRSLRDALEQDGHQVETAAGGAEGIGKVREAQAAEQPFSVVFTDLGMPGVDGRQVAREVKALAPRTPLIMLTGWGERLARPGNVSSDIDLVLRKPPRIRTLREALAQVCGDAAA